MTQSAIRSAIRSPIQSPVDRLDARLRRITDAALAVLRKYGTDAHLYLPGIGYVNGADAGNYLDTAFAATAVDSPVGLVMDAANTAQGSELIVNGGPFVGTTGWAASNSAVLSEVAGELVITANGSSNFPGATQSFSAVVGKTYELIFTGRRGTTSGSFGFNITGATPVYPSVIGSTVNVTVRLSVTANSTTVGVNPFIVGSPAAAGTVIFSGISVREVIGAIPAINTTTAQKPILRRDGAGGYYHEYSAASSRRLALSAVPFQMSDNFIVIAASQTNTATTVNAKPMFSIGGAGAGFFEVSYAPSTNYPRAIYKDDASVQDTLVGSIDYGNAPKVISAVKVGNTKTLRVDGADVASVTTALGAASITTSAIGARFSAGAYLPFYNDMLHGLILIKGTATAADVLTLERTLAAFQGRTI